MQSHFPHLFSSIQIGSMKVRNRIVMPAMSTNFAEPEHPGYVSARHKSYYGERAKGGAGLIFTETVNVNPLRGSRKFGLHIFDDRYIPGLRELVEVVHGQGARFGMQLIHSGRIGPMQVDSSGTPQKSGAIQYFAVSPLPHPMMGILAQEFDKTQLEEIAGYFAQAAVRAKKAGFDAVELHGGHGYMLNEFLSPRTNKRQDLYGGDIEGRTRFPLLVVRRLKESVGDDLILSYRISVVEFVEGGTSLEDYKFFVKKLEEAGVHIIHVSGGINETPLDMNRVIPPMSYPAGKLIPYAEQIKREVRIPVIAVQKIQIPQQAEEIIREGKADLIATARAFIADPHWPRKAQEGKTDEIRQCVGCNQGCIERIVMETSLTCLQNPEVGLEDQYGGGRKGKRKKFLIIGGGPAGMEAAYVLARQGHEVQLEEKEKQLGGTAGVASVLAEKKEFKGVVENLEKQMRKGGVKVALGKEAKGPLPEKQFDAILVATGSTPILPKMSLRRKGVFRLAKEVFKNPEATGKKVVILGGGSVGIELAEVLSRLGKEITVVEMLDKVCADLGPLNRPVVLERIGQTNIRILLETKVLEIRDDGLVIRKKGKEETWELPDTIIASLGGRPEPTLAIPEKGSIRRIGDCRQVGNALEAIQDAFRTALELGK